MVHALIVSLVIALVFFCLWRDEVEERKKAQLQVWMLQKKLKQKEKELQKQKETQKGKEPTQKQTKPPQPKQPPKRTVGPVTVETAQPAREYVIRKPEPKPAKPLLDQKKLAELQQQTREAQSMLAEIFVQEEQPVKVSEMKSERPPFMDVLERLLSKDMWTRDEIVQMVGPNVMIGNLLEQINDYSCSKIDDIVLEEDGDRIYVTVEYKDRLI